MSHVSADADGVSSAVVEATPVAEDVFTLLSANEAARVDVGAAFVLASCCRHSKLTHAAAAGLAALRAGSRGGGGATPIGSAPAMGGKGAAGAGDGKSSSGLSRRNKHGGAPKVTTSVSTAAKGSVAAGGGNAAAP